MKKDERFFPMAVSKHEKVLLWTQSCVRLLQQLLGVLWHLLQPLGPMAFRRTAVQ